MTSDNSAVPPVAPVPDSRLGGAFGVGVVLVVVPSIALLASNRIFASAPTFGLPILAIFGIMILFGSLALVSTLFARLELSDKSEALALPPGSIRAAIALALIVLFALISVMLFQTLSRGDEPVTLENLTFAEKEAALKESTNHVIGIVPDGCKASLAKPTPAVKPASKSVAVPTDAEPPATCTPQNALYKLVLRRPPSSESTDLAKQLLILVGTLMTSVTSFYFASRTAESLSKNLQTGTPEATTPPTKPDPGGSQPPVTETQQVASTANDERLDGCDVAVTNATPDEQLPQATGGVA